MACTSAVSVYHSFGNSGTYFTLHCLSVLQDTDYDILEAIKESKTVIEMLRAERQDESV